VVTHIRLDKSSGAGESSDNKASSATTTTATSRGIRLDHFFLGVDENPLKMDK
jgi:hypothetical protein